VACSIDKNLEEAQADLRSKLTGPGQHVYVISCDVTKKQDRQKVLEFMEQKYGRIDVLFANAGVSTKLSKQLELSEEVYDKTFNVNTKATFFIIKESISLLRKSK